MKIEYLIILMILILTGGLFILTKINPYHVTAQVVHPTEYKGIKIKFYDESQMQECLRLLDLVPPEYLDGLTAINVFSEREECIGHYYGSRVLELYGCSFDNINHELAHHRQRMTGDTPNEIAFHEGNFNAYEREIFEVMWQANGGSMD